MKPPFSYILGFKVKLSPIYHLSWTDNGHFIIFSLIFPSSQSDVVFYDYPDSSAVSSDSPNWQAYLIKRHVLVWLRDHSTHWRATCRYNTDGTVYTDYLRASFEDFDIVRVTPTVVKKCQKYELVNIRGNECENCTAATWYLKGSYTLCTWTVTTVTN